MLLTLLIAASLASPCLSTSGRFDQCSLQGSGPRLFRGRHTCAPFQDLDPCPGYTPWTHRPHCQRGNNSKTGKTQEYCIYTRSNGSTRRGVSIFTTSVIADEIADISHFDVYNLPESYEQRSYETRKLPGRGIGVIATRDIKMGETIITDMPTLILDREKTFRDEHDGWKELMWRGLLQLPEETQHRTRSLATSKGLDMRSLLEDITHTNGIGITLGDGRPHGAVLPEMSRINHSCRPNAFYRFDTKTLILKVLALRDIKRGEEVTISYTWTSVPTDYRKKILREHWGFECNCAVCGASAARIEESDQRIMFIFEAKESIDSGELDPRTILELATEIMHLYDEDGLITPKAEFRLIAARAADQLGDYETALRHAKDAIRYWTILMGGHSEEVRDAEKLVRDLDRRYRQR